MNLRWISSNSGAAGAAQYFILVYREDKKLKFKAVKEADGWPENKTHHLRFRQPRAIVTFYLKDCEVEPRKLVSIAERIVSYTPTA